MYVSLKESVEIYQICSKSSDSEAMANFLTFKAPITTAADDSLEYSFLCFSEKIRLDISSESSARQRIHMKHQALFSAKDKIKKNKCRLLQFYLALSGLRMVSVSKDVRLYFNSLNIWQNKEGNQFANSVTFKPLNTKKADNKIYVCKI